jgi:hypothetical protein
MGVSMVDEPDYRAPVDAPRSDASANEEVDKALAVLHDRHPDALRLERETQAALARKKAALDARAEADRSRFVRAWAKRVGVGIVLAVGIRFGWMQHSQRVLHERAVEAALSPLLEPYLARGFARVVGASAVEESLTLEVAEPSCFVAAASRAPGDGAVRVERARGPLEGSATVAWCACAGESATVRVARPSGEGGGVAVLRTPAAQVGGQLALVFLDPAPATIAPPDECAEAALDAWITAGVPARVADEPLDEDLRATLRLAGFRLVGSASARLPFAVVPAVADSCALAWSTSPSDRLSVRLPEGARAIADATGAVGVCSSRGVPFTVHRTGKGEVVVERVPARRVGGTHGLREVASRLGLSSVTVWVPEDELDWDASATLRASGVIAAEITAPADARQVNAARVVAMSVAGSIVAPDGPLHAGYACDPPLVDSPHIGTSVCVESTPRVWRATGVGRAGIAAAAFPFWMGALTRATEPRAIAAELALLRLGRRIVTDGFEQASDDGVSEKDGVTRVVGLGGRDGVIALQLSGEAPWVSPCSNGEVWAVDGDPAVVSLAPGETLDLKCTPRAPKDHRTIVFRHVAPKR